MQLGKLMPRGRLNAIAPGTLVYLQDRISQRRFLVDTGASYSIFPFASKSAPKGPPLTGPSGKTIPCWGEKTLALQFGDRSFQWTFLLADVGFPIIGADFLRHHRFLVDMANLQLAAPGAAHSLQLVTSAVGGLPGADSRSPATCGTVLTAGTSKAVAAAEVKAPSGSLAACTPPTR
jgi:hypothetical protein